MENTPITPLADRVLIKPIEEEESTYGNIVVPDMVKIDQTLEPSLL